MKITETLEALEKTLYGRSVYENGALALCWSLSGFEIRFRAERLELHFVPDYKADQPCYVKLVLDGCDERKYAISTGAEVILLENIHDGEHTLRFYRLSEGDRPIKLSKLTLSGDDCAILPAPKPSELRFEFFGDSITCGFGDMAGREDNVFTTYQEDPTRTYAFLTAKAFGADIRVEAISGQGIVKNCNGEVGYRIPEFFGHETRVGREPHDFTRWIPQAVIINAGTNDNGGRVPDEEFRREAGRFIDHIREVYPQAWIFWVYGMMGQRYDAVLGSLFNEKSASDKRLRYVPVKPIYDYPDETGAVGHPNEKGQARAAGILIEAINQALDVKKSV